jgi:TPR repeat protein
VPQDFAAAATWYRKAAEQGSPVAQNNLGVLYAKGQGVARDPVEAYFWFNLAANAPGGGNRESAANNRDALVGELTSGQTAAVQQRIQQWHPTKPAS